MFFVKTKPLNPSLKIIKILISVAYLQLCQASNIEIFWDNN